MKHHEVLDLDIYGQSDTSNVHTVKMCEEAVYIVCS